MHATMTTIEAPPPSKANLAQILKSPHQDYIHCIAFDYYGRRLATCSGDRTVKIWDLDDNGEWTSSPTPEGSSEWKAHLSSVTSVSWAHPEFGQLLASSGAEGTCCIWEERAEGSTFSSSSGLNFASSSNTVAGSNTILPTSTMASDALAPISSSSSNTSTTRWSKQATLTDARKSLSCVKFAPRHLRLQLATASADGFVRIYEAVDVMNLNQWVLNNSIEVEPDTSDLGVRCLDWCTGRFEPPTLVVGGSSGNVSIYRYSDASRNWGLYIRLESHPRGVLDLSWCPNVGRSYHLISSCGRDGVLRVHRLKRSMSSSDDSNGNGGVGALEFESSQVLDTGDEEVWRCSWNVTGTVLASSGDGNSVKLWKADYKGKWKCVSEVNGNPLS